MEKDPDNIFYGTQGGDVIDLRETSTIYVRGLGGDDTIYASNLGLDLHGGAGNDTIFGGSGADNLEGGEGNDVEYGGEGNDRGFALRGDDFIDAGAGSDTLIFQYIHIDTELADDPNIENATGVTYDLMWQGHRMDLGVFGHDLFLNFENITGGQGGDRFYGTSAANTLLGREGDDTLAGRSGDDRIYGGLGADRIYGGPGRDVMYGGQEPDLLFASGLPRDGARDTFVFQCALDSPLARPDIISGFEHGIDKIDLRPLHALSETIFYGGGGAAIYIDVSGSAGYEMRINVFGNVTLSDLIL